MQSALLFGETAARPGRSSSSRTQEAMLRADRKGRVRWVSAWAALTVCMSWHVYIYIYIYATPPSGTYVFVFMLHIDVTCTQALDTRNQETLCIAYWGDLSPRRTKPRNFTHRLLGGPVASLIGGILASTHETKKLYASLIGGRY